MYINKKYSVWDMLLWTRRELLLFTVLATVATVLFEVMELRWLQLPWTPIALVGTAVAFLIGFQNNAAYGRAWEARKIWGGIVNASRTWAVQVQALVNNEYAEQPMEQADLREHHVALVQRQIAWLTALRHAMRQPRAWEVFSKKGTNKEWHDRIHIPERLAPLTSDLQPLLSADEQARVSRATNKAAALVALQSEHLAKLKARGYVWEFSFLKLQDLLQELLTLQGQSERIKNYPYPRQYATLGYDFVWLFVLLLPLGVIPEFSEMGHTLTEYEPMVGQLFVWLAVPLTVMVSWVFSTMQRIGTVGENPFEGSANDVPISTMARAIEIDLRQLLQQEPEKIPAPLEAVLGVQM